MTINNFTSEVQASFKSVSSDQQLLNKRLIYSIAKPITTLLVKREANLRRLLNSPNIFTRINCLEMQEVPLAECCDYTSDKKIARSKHKIPKIVDAFNGLMVEYVSDIENSKRFVQSTPQRYANLLKLGSTKRYFWIYNDYLYVSDSNIKAVNLSAYFDEDPDYTKNGCDCEQPDKTQTCIAAYDKEFKAPGYLIDNIKSMTYQRLQQVYLQSAIDRTDNDNDETSR